MCNCGDRWNWKEEMQIPYTGRIENPGECSSFMFPLCKECFEKLSEGEILYYCKQLLNRWNSGEIYADWDNIIENLRHNIHVLKERRKQEEEAYDGQ